jgi:hypothetical protein
MIHSNQIKYFPVTIQDIDVAMKIWGKSISTLKGKTTQSKTQGSQGVIETHKEVFPKTDIFFVNKNPIFLTLSGKICFRAVSHLADRTVPHIFKAFK